MGKICHYFGTTLSIEDKKCWQECTRYLILKLSLQVPYKRNAIFSLVCPYWFERMNELCQKRDSNWGSGGARVVKATAS